MAEQKNDGAGCETEFLASLSDDLKHAGMFLRNAAKKVDNYRKRCSDTENEDLRSSVSSVKSNTSSTIARSRLAATLSLPMAVFPPTPEVLGSIVQDQLVLDNQKVLRMFTRPKKIFIRSLAYCTSDKSLESHFSHFGAVFEARVYRHPDGKTRYSGMVEFKYAESVNKVLAFDEPHVVDGRHVIVAPYQERRSFYGLRRDGCM